MNQAELFTDEPAPEADLFTDEPAPQKSIRGFGENAFKDVTGTFKGMGKLAEGLVMHPIDTTVNTVKTLPGAIMNEGKRLGVGELLTGHPINAVEKFGNAFYDKPLTTILDVLPAAGAAGKAFGIGGKAAEVGGLADEAAQVAKTGGSMVDDVARIAPEAPKPINLPDEAAQILKSEPVLEPQMPPSAPPGAPQAAEQAIPMGSTFQETVSNLGKQAKEAVKKPMDEVQAFVEDKYGRFAKKPSAIENAGKALEQKGRGMTLKEIGGTPGMARTLRDRFGEDVLNDLADLADKKGVTKGFFNWQTGNEIKNLMEESGSGVGAIRKMARERGALHNMSDLVNKIRAELDPIYLKGSGSAQKGAYMKALEDIKNAPNDPVSLAEVITEKNRFLKKNKLTQPIGAGTDVLNSASRLNNELIHKFLKPAESEAYKEALKDFSASKLFSKMYGHTYGRDMMGRSGPSSIWNTVKDVGGRKIMEKVFKNVGRKMQNNPDYFKNATNLSSDVLDSIGNAVDEAIDQMGDAPR